MSIVPVKVARNLLGEPLKQYSWEVVIPDPPALLIPVTLGFSIRARGASIPGSGNEAFQTRWGPFTYNHTGKRTYPRRLGLRFEEGYKFPILPMLAFWNDLIFSESTGVGFPQKNLTSNMWIRLLGPEMEPTGIQPTSTIHVYSAFPVEVPDSPLDYASPTQVFYDVTFAYDYWRYELWPF